MKKEHLKKGIEKVLINTQLIIIVFYCVSIEGLGNPTYNKIFIATIIFSIINFIVLNKYSRTFNLENLD